MDVDPDTALYLPEGPVISRDSVRSNGSWTRASLTGLVDPEEEEEDQATESEASKMPDPANIMDNTTNGATNSNEEEENMATHSEVPGISSTVQDCLFSVGVSDDEQDFLFDNIHLDWPNNEDEDADTSTFIFQDNSSFLDNHRFIPNFIDNWLFKKYEKEARTICEKLKEVLPKTEIETLRCADLLDIFVPDSCLHLVKDFCNCRLRQLKRKETDTEEFRLCIVAYLRCAVCSASFTETFSQEEKHWFGLRGRLNIGKERCLEVLQSLSGPAPNVVGNFWEHISADTSTFLPTIEEAACRINRSLLLTETCIMSIDDDHIRQRSRKVSEQTNLKVANNPKKAIGPVQTAICSALTGFFIVGHYSLQGEEVRDTFGNLFMFIQGARHPK